jgi:hypothetical protein
MQYTHRRKQHVSKMLAGFTSPEIFEAVFYHSLLEETYPLEHTFHLVCGLMCPTHLFMDLAPIAIQACSSHKHLSKIPSTVLRYSSSPTTVYFSACHHIFLSLVLLGPFTHSRMACLQSPGFISLFTPGAASPSSAHTLAYCCHIGFACTTNLPRVISYPNACRAKSSAILFFSQGTCSI